jgi:A/G-specific adenine glycosylase
MLQQTQTSQVLQKYQDFIDAFPDFSALATAPLRNVLQAWQDLGYNRRAVALWKTAQMVVASFNGKLPSSVEVLMAFPGSGRSTASAIAAFAFNQPTVFV